ncbi:hypothetical protein BGX38DRAFT_651437 [Terfezia claveryi]|nr:hypothetical protein BGX38DRAFT_651437 [Terfezia claveryi]
MSTSVKRQVAQDLKSTSIRFRKRWLGLFKKPFELGHFCHADIYLLVRRDGKCYVYKSVEAASWPPPLESLVGSVA